FRRSTSLSGWAFRRCCSSTTLKPPSGRDMRRWPGPSPCAPYMGEQWRRMRAFERCECRRVDHVIAGSEVDRDTFRDEYGVTAVSAIPTGVDVHFFCPSQATVTAPNEIVFVGSMDAIPKGDAATG